jgi:hypothetical protein
MKSPLICASALTLVAVLSLAAQSPVPETKGDNNPPAADADLTGVYACEGVRPDGAAYRGTVEIVRHDGTYELLWTLPPHEQYVGIGMVSGSVLAVSYFGGMPGLVVYRIEAGDKGPRLVGQWTVVDADGHVFPETLTKVAEAIIVPPVAKPRPGRAVPSRGMRPI